MADYQLTAKAVEDLESIYDCTESEFGAVKADAYLSGLEQQILLIAQTPGLAHKVDDIRQGYRRYLYESHAIYLTELSDSILVVRVLHQRMNFSLHLL